MRSFLEALRAKAWRIVDRYATLPQRSTVNSRIERAELAYGTSLATCVFHVGFISICETAEQLDRLRNEPVSCDYSPARSRFIRHVGSHFVAPINVTAAKVAGGDDGR
jgi:hypothetical protein